LLDGTVINGGAIEGNGIQIGYQLAASLAISGYAFFVSLIILYVINLIPGLALRVSAEDELKGGDITQMGEFVFFENKEEDKKQSPKELEMQ
jgi:Amt family ammonium transporter